MRIAVGTTNPIKIRATESIVTKIWANATVLPVKVDSGVSDQPLTDEETVKGAINRATRARSAVNADIGIGLEGGISQRPFGTFLSNWCAVQTAEGKIWIGGGVNIPLPPTVINKIADGQEMGEVMDQLTGMENIKHGTGIVGILTHGLLDRYRCSELVIIYALAPLISPGYYSSDLPLQNEIK